MQRRVAVVQQKCVLTPALQDAIVQCGFNAKFVSGVNATRKLVLDHRPALLIIDTTRWGPLEEELLLSLADLKQGISMRRIILAGRAEAEDSVSALDLGADDFLLMPISPRELKARFEATLRSLPPDQLDDTPQVLGTLRLKRNEMEVVVGGVTKQLTKTECNLLGFLMDNAGLVVSREKILDYVWFESSELAYPRVIDVYVWRLREKIEDVPAYPTRLLTKRGCGYTLIDPDRQNA